jgi:2-haloalkanoic acid dehalogenase type II
MTKSLSDFSTLTFDCYGTLIDWESGIWDALQPLVEMAEPGTIRRDAALVAFAEAESAQQEQTPGMRYPELLEQVHASLAKRFDLQSTAEMNRAFGQSVPHWPAFPDSADALRVLARHYKLVVLSNVDRDGFAASRRKLGVDFDAVYTAQDVGSYKPNPRNFDYMLDRLKADHGIEAGRILHTAQSLFHDHVPAGRVGLARAWIDRQNLHESGQWGATARVAERPTVDFRFSTLADMAARVEGAR